MSAAQLAARHFQGRRDRAEIGFVLVRSHRERNRLDERDCGRELAECFCGLFAAYVNTLSRRRARFRAPAA
jgi:hypothetical protein